MRILVIAQLYRPEPNFITADVAEMLALHGKVTVVTTHPSYPLGRFYDSVTSRWPKRERRGNLTVWRLPIIPDQSSSVRRRALSYVSFLVAAALWAPIVCPRPKVVWVYNTPFTVALAAAWFRLTGARVVFTAADLWPESFTAAGVVREGPLMRVLYAYRRWSNRLADLIVAATPGTARSYLADGYPQDRLRHVPVWVDVPRGGRPPGVPALVPRIVYAGNLGIAQRLDTVIEAAGVLRKRGVRVRFELFGCGAAEESLRALAARVAPDNVFFQGRVSPERAFAELAGATGQIVSLRRSQEFAHTVPSKLYGSFAAATPLLFGLEGDARQIALTSGGGIEFDPDDPSSLADAVESLLALSPAEHAEMRRRLRQLYDTCYDRDVLLDTYRELILGDPASPPSPADSR